MGHGHHHNHHHHGHHHHHFNLLQGVFWLTFAYLLVEIGGGIVARSLALLADGFHMFADATAIGMSAFAAWFAHRPAPPQKTFGYQRVEILAAFFNGIILIAMGCFILFESFERFRHPLEVRAGLMMGIAVGGLLVNVVSAWLLHREQHANLNIKGAYLHILGDLLGSVGAIAAGLLIMLFGWYWADPVISVVMAFLVMFSAVNLLRDAANILLEGCPRHIDIERIRQEILCFEGITAIHHLHVWNIDMSRTVLTAHLEVTQPAFSGETLSRVQDALKEKFSLSHVTIQMELA